jgi:hypothetical protein
METNPRNSRVTSLMLTASSELKLSCSKYVDSQRSDIGVFGGFGSVIYLSKECFVYPKDTESGFLQKYTNLYILYH